MLPKTCFSSRLAAVAHFETRRLDKHFFQTKTNSLRWAGEAGCDSADISSCWGVIAGDEAVLPHASWISFTSDHLESLFDCDLFAEPSLEAAKLQSIPKGCLLRVLSEPVEDC